MAEMAIPPRTGKYPQHPCVASVLTNDPKHFADQVHLTICNLDSDDLDPTAYQNLMNNPAYTETDPDSYRIDNMHAKEEPHES